MHAFLSRSLEYFSAIYAHRSLGKASAALGVSQPALSKSLRQLEDDMGTPLFIRRPWGMEPTKFARALMRHGELMSRQVKALGRDIHALHNAQLGTVRVGMNLGSAAEIIPASVLHLSTHRPGIRVFLVEGSHESLIGGVLGGELDLAVTTAPLVELPAELLSENLFSDPFVIALARDHPLAQDDVNDDRLPLLLEHPWVLPPDEGILRPRVIDMFQRAGLKAPIPRVESLSLIATMQLLRDGRFLTLQPRSVLRNALIAAHVTAIEHPKLVLPRQVVCIQKRSSEQSPMTGEFVDALKESSIAASMGLAV